MIITIPDEVNIGARIEGAISNYLRQCKFLLLIYDITTVDLAYSESFYSAIMILTCYSILQQYFQTNLNVSKN